VKRIRPKKKCECGAVRKKRLHFCRECAGMINAIMADMKEGK